MRSGTRFTATISLIAALGGFLMGFDASVISGVIGFIETEFALTKLQLGWIVSSLALTATFGMLIAGPLSDRIGRRAVLIVAALLFAVSAILSALAPNFAALVFARMLGGLGVGAALIVAPIYIAELAPPEARGRLVSLNQLNIVIGISMAFFSNYLLLKLGVSELSWTQALGLDDWTWRWMLGVEALPAMIYFFALLRVPESPRWLAMHDCNDAALAVFERTSNPEVAVLALREVQENLKSEQALARPGIAELLHPSLRRVLLIGLSVGILQQLVGINAVLFYAPMIFARTGVATDAAFMQAVIVGLVNLVFTVAAIALVDRAGRRPLLGFGLAGMAAGMLLLSFAFYQARYTLDSVTLDALPVAVDSSGLASVVDKSFASDIEFREAVTNAIGADAYARYESQLVAAAIDVDRTLVLLGVLGFIASFAISIGPVMWVLFSELFPNRIRGLAVSIVGLVNSSVSFLVSLVFPWELETLGNATTFLIYAVVATAGLLLLLRILPETRGFSLEELQQVLVRR